ncbi:MAG: DNA helicase UvrB [Phycisphaerales bacterium]|nr:DNA helicase UvrB [Phycisphaerales bacterium]
MKCEHCDKPAVVHETIIKSGIDTEVHLCAEHAIAAGYPLPLEQPIADIFPQLAAVAKVEGASTKERSSKCHACGLTFASFRKTAMLGCATCYDAFMPMIEQVIERAQVGATHHLGRSPKGGAEVERTQLLRAKLMRDLESAVATEQYERAAKIRDELKALDTTLP